MKTGKSNKKRLLLVLNIVVLLGLGAATTFLYLENKDLRELDSLTTEERNEIKNQEILAKVKSLINVPDGDPVFLLVNDPESAFVENPGLRNIFSDLQKGDYILVYRKERSGIQYRPSENRIITSRDIAFPVEIELFGSLASIEDARSQLVEFGNQISINQVESSSIAESFVYDVDGDQEAEAEAIAAQLNIGVSSTLPNGLDISDSTEIVVALSDKDSTNSANSSDKPSSEESTE